MQPLSDGADLWLTYLYDREFAAEIANHAIGSEAVQFGSSRAAILAMLRRAYLKGREDALTPAQTFDEAVAQVKARQQR